MPEYLAPGVFVEETSFRSKSIEGVSTSTTAFVGPTRSGPVGEIPELLTSFSDFETIYGGLEGVGGKLNYIGNAVMGYFNEGGARLYVARVYPIAGTVSDPDPYANPANPGNPKVAIATVEIPAAGGGGGGGGGVATQVGYFRARFPGASLNGNITVTPLVAASSVAAAQKAVDGSMFRVRTANDTKFFTKSGTVFTGKGGAGDVFPAADANGTTIEMLTLQVAAEDNAGNGLAVYPDLGYHPDHKRYIGGMLAVVMNSRADHLSTPYAFVLKTGANAFQVQEAFDVAAGAAPKKFTLAGGEDPAVTQNDYNNALQIIEGIDDVSIVAAPGYTEIDADGIALSLIAHAEKRRSYRIAVLDVPAKQLPSGAQATKSKLDSKYAALYYPWVVTPNPDFDPNDGNSDAELTLPPSGFVCGIYARSDIERGVWKAPANEVVRSALRFERLTTTGEQELLNPIGVNCLRYFAGRGNRVWGARTISSDPEWKYVNVRRYFNYLEHSIDNGTQWAVFEPNGERLWANVRDTVSSFLYNEWVNGALLGDKPEQAFFVKCDRSTMTQNDLDNGRLICLIGVAVIKPAEFVIFRIGQKTADARS
jgi:phage tail sheath protein FI